MPVEPYSNYKIGFYPQNLSDGMNDANQNKEFSSRFKDIDRSFLNLQNFKGEIINAKIDTEVQWQAMIQDYLPDGSQLSSLTEAQLKNLLLDLQLMLAEKSKSAVDFYNKKFNELLEQLPPTVTASFNKDSLSTSNKIALKADFDFEHTPTFEGAISTVNQELQQMRQSGPNYFNTVLQNREQTLLLAMQMKKQGYSYAKRCAFLAQRIQESSSEELEVFRTDPLAAARYFERIAQISRILDITDDPTQGQLRNLMLHYFSELTQNEQGLVGASISDQDHELLKPTFFLILSVVQDHDPTLSLKTLHLFTSKGTVKQYGIKDHEYQEIDRQVAQNSFTFESNFVAQLAQKNAMSEDDFYAEIMKFYTQHSGQRVKISPLLMRESLFDYKILPASTPEFTQQKTQFTQQKSVCAVHETAPQAIVDAYLDSKQEVKTILAKPDEPKRYGAELFQGLVGHTHKTRMEPVFNEMKKMFNGPQEHHHNRNHNHP
jgi:hypothetical protein